MYKIIIVVWAVLFSHFTFAQETEITWSPLGEKEKESVLKVAEMFMKKYTESDFQSIQKFLPDDEVNYGGEVWLKTPEFLAMLKQLRGEDELAVKSMSAYTMDDTERNPDVKAKALKIYRMFSNLSVFVTVEITNKTESSSNVICLNFNLDDNKKWIVSSFLNTSVGFAAKDNFPKDKFRMEFIDDLHFTLPVPQGFSQGDKEKNQITYTLSGDTKRDAAIQVGWYDLKAPVGVMSYQWVQYLTSQYDHSDILIKYMPYGYKFEYYLKDQNDNLNKGITVGFKSHNEFVFVQYFSFSDVYDRIWVAIDEMMRNIRMQ